MDSISNTPAVAGGPALEEAALLRNLRGSFFSRTDLQFVLIAVLSVCLHYGFLGGLRLVKLQHKRVQSLEEIPERFARLIAEKPIPKKKKHRTLAPALAGRGVTAGREAPKNAAPVQPAAANAPQVDAREKALARERVAAQVANVEEKIRTVGVLAMLSGMGATAKGPPVADVLGSVNKGRERTQDIEKALADMSGLTREASIDVAQKKLVRSRDVAVGGRENVDALLTGVSSAATRDLSKKGDIIFSQPQSIEGAGSASEKRDIAAINGVVATHRLSIRMSYERFLKRAPDLAGKITVRFTIDAAGNVSNVEIVENTTGNKEIEDDIIRKVGMWKFEAIGEGEVRVTYPFMFQPAG